MALECIYGLHAEGRLPILLGGTGLYIKAVTDLYRFEPIRTDGDLRQSLRLRAESEGREALHADLERVDPESAGRIHPNDLRRVVRALEVYHITGKPISSQQTSGDGNKPFDLLMIGLMRDRQDLYDRIEKRVDEMMNAGFLEEVRRLLDMGYSPYLYPMQALGYKEMVSHLLGGFDLWECIRLFKRNTRRFAKRQITWFKRDRRIRWINMGDDRGKPQVVEDIVRLLAGLCQEA
jgi:tRNA dimethylallyltransferase